MASAVGQPEKSGMQKLDDIATDFRLRDGLRENKYPIVLVPGFSGFGEPVFGSINYWGGFEDLASELQAYADELTSLLGRPSRILPGSPSDGDYARWAAEVVNIHIQALGYQVRVPTPGRRIPLADMLPVLAVTSIAISGNARHFGFSELNDGIVDTDSMLGPEGSTIRDIDAFNRDTMADNLGVYWHFGMS
ncbi:hypothetical protein AB5N19_12396 [Seiridium cardinale]|uniref:Uncharacterized protein n=1 Tax=Seiridium cardinale TaxID=138064 RepID=A0ABR2XTF4_9PEZI